MSTIKSQTEHLTLNADGSGKEIKFQANGVEKAKIDANGDLHVGNSVIRGSSNFDSDNAGKVLQVVQQKFGRDQTGGISTTSTSLVDTGIFVNININDNSKLLVTVSIPDVYVSTNYASAGFMLNIDGVDVYSITSHHGHKTNDASRAGLVGGTFLSNALSSGLKNVKVRFETTGGTIGFHNGHTWADSQSSIVVQEIGA